MISHDIMIIGGGTAGCILAARLSESGRRRVTLIEAGADTPPGAVPADITDTYPISYFNPAYFWQNLAASGVDGSSAAPFLQARIMGGGSSVMGMWALRGLPGDYDSWAAAGATGWSWSDVLPAFRRLERDLDFSEAEQHGGSGPIPVRRHWRERWPGFAEALLRAAERRGLPYRTDLNSDFADGVFPIPVANDFISRSTSASGFLTSCVRRRSNLEIMARTEALRLVLDGHRVVGVVVRRDNQTEQYVCREVIVCAGAIGSPALLLRSGIGPSDQLRLIGIDPLVDLPGVGQQLQNHCVLNLAMPISPSARQSLAMRTYGLALARVSSGFPGSPAGDLQLQFVARTGVNPHGNRVGVVGAALSAPASRGSISLTTADARVMPRIEFRLLTSHSDRDRMKRAIGFALQLLDDSEVRRVRGEVFVATPTSLIRRLNGPGWRNHLASRALSIVLDSPKSIRRQALRLGGTLVATDELGSVCPDHLLSYVTPVFHPTGTCAIGRKDDPFAVLDACCRVRGVAGLRVADASIMPNIPRGNTCLPVMMIAERLAELYQTAAA